MSKNKQRDVDAIFSEMERRAGVAMTSDYRRELLDLLAAWHTSRKASNRVNREAFKKECEIISNAATSLEQLLSRRNESGFNWSDRYYDFHYRRSFARNKADFIRSQIDGIPSNPANELHDLVESLVELSKLELNSLSKTPPKMGPEPDPNRRQLAYHLYHHFIRARSGDVARIRGNFRLFLELVWELMPAESRTTKEGKTKGSKSFVDGLSRHVNDTIRDELKWMLLFAIGHLYPRVNVPRESAVIDEMFGEIFEQILDPSEKARRRTNLSKLLKRMIADLAPDELETGVSYLMRVCDQPASKSQAEQVIRLSKTYWSI